MPMKKRYYTRTISVVVSESMYQQLVARSDKTDSSLSQWIRDAISLRFINPLENLDEDT